LRKEYKPKRDIKGSSTTQRISTSRGQECNEAWCRVRKTLLFITIWTRGVIRLLIVGSNPTLTTKKQIDMEQTAVELLEEKLRTIIPINLMNDILIRDSILEAKEMFEKQIINASNESFMNGGLVERRVKNKKVFSVGEQYYNETFKSE